MQSRYVAGLFIAGLLMCELGVSLETQTAFGLPTPYVVVSGSMVPTLPVGSIVVTQPIDYNSVKVGDIIIYREGGLNIVHRVIAVNASGMYTKGDHNQYPDEPRFWPPLHPSQIEAKVLLTIPYAGLVSMDFPLDYRFLFAITVIAFLVVSALIPKKPKAKTDHGEV